MRSLTEIMSDMRDIAKLMRARHGTGITEGEATATLEMIAIDVGELAQHVRNARLPDLSGVPEGPQ